MAFGIGNIEFPNVSNYDSDLRELIAMYRKLRSDYAGIIEAIEELKNHYEELDKNIDTVINEKIDATVTMLINRVDKLDNDCKLLREYVEVNIHDLSTFVEARIKDNKDYTDYSIKTMEDMLNRELAVLAFKIKELRIYTDTIVTSIDRDISKQIEELKEFVYTFTVDQVSVINPITHKRETIQKTVDDICEQLHAWSLRVREYDALVLKADEFDSMGLTAYELEYLGRWYLKEKRELIRLYNNTTRWVKEQLMMNSPMSGKRLSVIEVIGELFKYLQGSSLTVDEWDNLLLTVTEYEALDLTAYEHDWRSHMLIAANRYHGLTADEWVRLGIDRNNHIVYN